MVSAALCDALKKYAIDDNCAKIVQSGGFIATIQGRTIVPFG
jgi:hypothetical protein